MRKVFRTLMITSAALFAVAMMAAPASAVAIIDFNSGTSGLGGKIDNLGGGVWTGSGIPITEVDISGAPLNDGTFAVTGGTLSFDTTGAGSISITGSIPSLGIGAVTLLSGTISSFTASGPMSPCVSGDPQPCININAAGADTKYAGLLEALGLPTDTKFNFFDFTVGVQRNATGTGFHAVSTDIENTAETVPEPGSMILLGTGLIGLGGAVRRRLAKKK